MKNSLRKISLIVFMAIILNMFSFPFATGAESYKTFEKEITVLNKLGIFDEAYSLLYSEEAVTREEFVVYAMKMLKMEASADASESIFFDVDTENPSYAYIKAAYEYGVISGIGGGLFGGGSEITTSEAVSILLKCIKYNILAEQSGGYPEGYMFVAKQLGITDGISTSGYINKGQAAGLIFNAMEAPYLDVSGVKNSSYVWNETESTLFETLYNVYRERGIIDENRYVALPAGDGLSIDAIKINNILIGEGTTSAADFLGYTCDVYYQETDEIKTALYIEEKNNTSVKINSLYVKKLNSDSFIYYTDNHEKEKELKISPYAVAIWNNSIYKITGEVTLPNTGELEIIDNNSDNIYDIIKIKSYEIFGVSSVNNTANIIYNTDDSTDNIKFSDYDDIEIRDTYNNILSIKNIQPKSVLSIARNKEKTYIEIVVCEKTDDFYVKTIQQNLYGEWVISDNNNLYTVASSFAGNIELDKKYVFGLDLYGKVAYIFSDENEGLKYGYLMKWGTIKKGLEEKAMFKILTADDEIINFTAKEKITTISGNDYAVNVVKKQNSPTIINYSVDSDGLLSSIYFPTTDKNELHVCGIASAVEDARYSSQTKTIGGQILVNSATVIFSVGDNVDEEGDFKVYPIGTLKNDSYYVNSTGYSKSDEEETAEAVVVSSANISQIDENTPLMLFHGYGTVFDTELKESFDVIYGYIADEYVEIRLNSDVKLTYAGDNRILNVSQGDILQVLQNARGELVRFNVVYSKELDSILSSHTASNTGFAANERYDLGTPCNKKSNTFKMILKGETEPEPDIYVPLATRTAIYEYDSSKSASNRIRIISFDEIEAHNGYNNFNGMAFVSVYKTIPELIVVYK